LGLAIVKGIADRHLATIQLESGPGGCGLSVSISFPM
jgi:signal transduction histidine kinase